MRDFYLLAVLTLTAYRITRLAVRDDLPPILWLRDRLVGGWRFLTPKELERYRAAGWSDPWRSQVDTVDGVLHVYVTRKPWVPWWLAELLSCPWCVSAYISGALTASADILVGVPSPWLTAVAVWAGAAMLASRRTL